MGSLRGRRAGAGPSGGGGDGDDDEEDTVGEMATLSLAELGKVEMADGDGDGEMPQGRPRQPTMVVEEAMEDGWRQVTLLESEGKFNEAAEVQANLLMQAKSLYDEQKLKVDAYEAGVGASPPK